MPKHEMTEEQLREAVRAEAEAYARSRGLDVARLTPVHERVYPMLLAMYEEMRPGDAPPRVAEIARRLGTHQANVSKALSLLAEHGKVVSFGAHARPVWVPVPERKA
jgi:DNA-binding MarR family transcriptional regulator